MNESPVTIQVISESFYDRINSGKAQPRITGSYQSRHLGREGAFAGFLIVVGKVILFFQQHLV